MPARRPGDRADCPAAVVVGRDVERCARARGNTWRTLRAGIRPRANARGRRDADRRVKSRRRAVVLTGRCSHEAPAPVRADRRRPPPRGRLPAGRRRARRRELLARVRARRGRRGAERARRLRGDHRGAARPEASRQERPKADTKTHAVMVRPELGTRRWRPGGERVAGGAGGPGSLTGWRGDDFPVRSQWPTFA